MSEAFYDEEGRQKAEAYEGADGHDAKSAAEHFFANPSSPWQTQYEQQVLDYLHYRRPVFRSNDAATIDYYGCENPDEPYEWRTGLNDPTQRRTFNIGWNYVAVAKACEHASSLAYLPISGLGADNGYGDNYAEGVTLVWDPDALPDNRPANMSIPLTRGAFVLTDSGLTPGSLAGATPEETTEDRAAWAVGEDTAFGATVQDITEAYYPHSTRFAVDNEFLDMPGSCIWIDGRGYIVNSTGGDFQDGDSANWPRPALIPLNTDGTVDVDADVILGSITNLPDEPLSGQVVRWASVCGVHYDRVSGLALGLIHIEDAFTGDGAHWTLWYGVCSNLLTGNTWQVLGDEPAFKFQSNDSSITYVEAGSGGGAQTFFQRIVSEDDQYLVGLIRDVATDYTVTPLGKARINISDFIAYALAELDEEGSGTLPETQKWAGSAWVDTSSNPVCDDITHQDAPSWFSGFQVMALPWIGKRLVIYSEETTVGQWTIYGMTSDDDFESLSAPFVIQAVGHNPWTERIDYLTLVTDDHTRPIGATTPLYLLERNATAGQEWTGTIDWVQGHLTPTVGADAAIAGIWKTAFVLFNHEWDITANLLDHPYIAALSGEETFILNGQDDPNEYGYYQIENVGPEGSPDWRIDASSQFVIHNPGDGGVAAYPNYLAGTENYLIGLWFENDGEAPFYGVQGTLHYNFELPGFTFGPAVELRKFSQPPPESILQDTDIVVPVWDYNAATIGAGVIAPGEMVGVYRSGAARDFTKLSINVTTNVASTPDPLLLGCYIDADGVPGDMLWETTIPCDTIQVEEITGTFPVPENCHFVMVNPDGNAGSVTCKGAYPAAPAVFMWGFEERGSTWRNGAANNHTALPASLDGWVYTSDSESANEMRLLDGEFPIIGGRR